MTVTTSESHIAEVMALPARSKPGEGRGCTSSCQGNKATREKNILQSDTEGKGHIPKGD